MSPYQGWKLLITYGAALLVSFACSVEDRTLSFGTSGPSGLSQAGRTHYDPGATGGEGGAAGESSEGGGKGLPEPSSNAGAPGGNTALGGSASNTAGSTMGGGGTAQGGASGSGGLDSLGGTASAGTGGIDPNQGPCGDLDANGVQDCEETAVENATFDKDPQNWSADFGVAAAWSAQDALGRSGSGSLNVKFTTSDGSGTWATSAVSQCIQAWEGTVLELGGRALIPDGQGAGNAQLHLAMFGNDACAGSFIGTTTPLLTVQTGSWQTLHGSVKLAPGTRSVLLRLAVAKPGTQASLEAYFDNILLRAR